MVCVAVNIIMFFWSLFLVSSFPFFTHADVDLMTHGYDDEAIFQTFLNDGEVYDCIDIYKQPSMKHPLLINHTIQMKPTSYPEMTQRSKTNGAYGEPPIGVARPWLLPESCPEGSVPMRRVQHMMGDHNSSDVDLHLRRHRHYFLGRNRTNNYSDQKNQKNVDFMRHEHCALQIFGNGYRYVGSRADIALCSPGIENRLEFSLAQMWINSMDGEISLEAGWTEYPVLYGDTKTRFFTMWTTNRYATYCFNNQCGYVHTNPDITPDTYFTPFSFVGGPEYSVNIEIFQDPTTKDWWVSLQGNDMGYWPRDLVPSFESGVELVQFGGEVLNMRANEQHTATEMGLGTFPNEGPGRAAFFKNIEVLHAGSSGDMYQPPVGNNIEVRLFREFPDCYNIQLGSSITDDWGYHFFYGGPGRSTICP